MDSREIESPAEADYTAAVPLEIDEETATRADDLLREFAEDAGLETALIVDRSGALVAGISAEAEVTVEVISALVAGASGAMRALVSRLGETGAVESLHLGGNRLVYLKEIVNRFILVAVAEVSQPAGLVRQKALAIEPRLDELLHETKPPEVAPPAPAPAVRSLRAIARERAALREAGLAAAVIAPTVEVEEEIRTTAFDDDGIHVEEHESVQVEEIVVAEFPEEVPVEESFETLEDLAEEVEAPVESESADSPAADVIEPAEEVVAELGEALVSPFESAEEDEESEEEDEDEDVIEAEAAVETQEEGIELPEPLESGPAPEPVPREILEPIDFGEPEIVIESSLPPVTPPTPRIPLPVDSPFEAEDDEEEELAITLSHENEANVFEVEEEDDVETDPGDFEDLQEAEPASLLPDPPAPPASLFEFADEDDDEDEFEDFLIEDEPGEEDDAAPASAAPAPAFPDYVARRPTSLFEMAGDEDLEDDFAPFTVDEEEEAEADAAGESAAPPAIFEADDDDEDLLDDVPAHLTPVPPEPGEKTKTSSALEEMIAEEEEEEQIRSAGPFYF